MHLHLEVSDHVAVVSWIHKFLKVFQDLLTLAGVEALFRALKCLHIKVHFDEAIKAGDLIKVNVEQGFKCLKAFSELAHGGKMDGVASVVVILQSQDFAVPFDNIACVLFKQLVKAKVEFFVSFDCAGIVGSRSIHKPPRSSSP